MGIIRTEAVEFGGVPEVPDHKHGTTSNFFSAKRDARPSSETETERAGQAGETYTLKLHLVRTSEGIKWTRE